MSNENFSEKVSVNINSSTLSAIDLLIDNGYYSNRSDFINQALRDSIGRQQSIIDRISKQNDEKEGDPWFIGVSGITRRGLAETYESGSRALALRGYGVLVIDRDCDLEQLFAVYESIRIRGRVVCSDEVRDHFKIK